jgi:hypothetical protein
MRVIYSYPDQLLSSVWVDWCESVLDPAKSNFRHRPNFQTALGAENSNDRTRALEINSVGLLKGPLIRPQSSTGGAIPLGWRLVQSGIGAQSRLGYLAYAIGRVMRDGIVPQSVKRAFSVLCTLFVLQMGIDFQDKIILTASLYQYLLKHFQPSETLPANWNRYLAVAMFCTLHAPESEALIKTYLSDEPADKLYLVYSDGRKQYINPDELAKMAEENAPVSSVSPTKRRAILDRERSRSRAPGDLYSCTERGGISASICGETRTRCNKAESPQSICEYSGQRCGQ